MLATFIFLILLDMPGFPGISHHLKSIIRCPCAANSSKGEFGIDNTLFSYDNAHEVAWEKLCAYAKQHLGMDREQFARCHKAAQQIVKERLGADCAALRNRQLRYQILLEENGKPLHHAIAMNDLYWDTLITDEKADPVTVESLRNKGMEVYQVGLDDLSA